MASSLAYDLYCPVCCQVFKDPLLLYCNHNCCRQCLKNWWADKSSKKCPVCKIKSTTDDPPLNQELKTFCESLMEGSLCTMHSEKMKLFCLDHRTPACTICKDSGAHRDHRFSPIDEVLPDLREQLHKCLGQLKDRLKGLNKSKDQFTSAAAHIRAQAQLTEMQIQGQFMKFHQFLKNEEQIRLQAVRDEERLKTQKLTDKMAAVNRDIAALTQTITATEDQLKATDVSFLLSYKDAVEKVEKCFLLEEPQLGSKALFDQARHVGNMAFNIWNDMKKMVTFSPIILNPNTAHPELMMSEDLTGVGRTRMLNLPENPERFNCYSRVLGSEGFTTGKHSWVVKVSHDSFWAIGVIGESVLRRGRILRGFWSIFVSHGTYKTYNGTGNCKALNVKKKLENVKVKLDFSKGKLSFKDANTSKVLHTFTLNCKERLFPFFETHSGTKMKILPASEIELNVRYY